MKGISFFRHIAGLSFGLTVHASVASVPIVPTDLPAADAQKSAIEWPETATVQELLRLDTQAALKQASVRLSALHPVGSNSHNVSKGASLVRGGRNDRLQLKAIYGVGTHLAADVEINGMVHRYRRAGTTSGSTATKDRYLLVSIDGSCVQMRKSAMIRTICLSPRLGGDRS
jgi:hypothetical protein